MRMDVMKDDIVQWLYHFFSRRGKFLDVDLESQIKMDVFDTGLIDSMGLIELVAAIESKFNFKFTSESLQDPKFKTIEGISEIILKNKSNGL